MLLLAPRRVSIEKLWITVEQHSFALWAFFGRVSGIGILVKRILGSAKGFGNLNFFLFQFMCADLQPALTPHTLSSLPQELEKCLISDVSFQE